MADDHTNVHIRKEDDSGWWVIGAEDVFQVDKNEVGDYLSDRYNISYSSIS